MPERIHKSQTDKLLMGVCGGLAAYFRVDPVLVRAAFVVVTLVWGAGLLLYLALVVIMPGPQDTGPVDETVRRNLDELSHEAQARAHKLREALRSDDTRRRNALAVTLIVIGALLLAGHAGGLLFVSWVVVVPLLLIALGVAVLLGVFQRRIP